MFLTVQEAIDLSGKSQTTIHRLCQKHDGSKYIRKERNKYLIDKDFLLDKYPIDGSGDEDSSELADVVVDGNLLKELTEKNERIAELIRETTELRENIESKQNRITELEDELFDHQHELAEVLDANIYIGQELSAIKEISSVTVESSESDSETETFDLEAHKRGVRYTVAGITIASMLLIAFVFMMYYLTK